jgi:thioredoxin-related protein
MKLKANSAFLIFVLTAVFALTGSSCRKTTDTDTESPKEGDERVQTVSAAVADEKEKGAATEKEEGAATEKEEDATLELEWVIDFEKAKESAGSEGKNLFINFTGSDWCPWCDRLEKEVFSKKVFVEYAEKNFVLVELDFPNNRAKLSAETQQQNEQLRAEFGVQGFPTIVITDKDGTPYAQSGYVEGGAVNYVEHLNQFQAAKKQADELIVKSEDVKIESTERAVFLDRALQLLPPWTVDKYHVDKMKRIAELDTDNKGGLKNQYLIRIEFIGVQQALQKGEFDAALKKLDAIIDEYKPSGQVAQHLYFARAHASNGLNDTEGEKESLQKALEAAPDGFLAKQIEAYLKEL